MAKNNRRNARRKNRIARQRRQSKKRFPVLFELLEPRILLAADFGDAPSPYPVTIVENGAQHAVGVLSLGTAPDMEADGTHSANADADGADEDGDLDVLGTSMTDHRVGWYAQNQVPKFSSPLAADIEENTTLVHLLTAEDSDYAPSLTFSIDGSTADNSLFETTNGNELRFKLSPDFENPTDVGGVAGDNIYEVTVRVDDGNSGVASKTMFVSVTDVEKVQQVGTDGDDDISLTFTESEIQILINGATSTFAYESDLSSGIVEIDGLGGNDTIQVNLSDVDDSVVTRFGLTRIQNAQLETNTFNIETVELFAGEGIDDILFLDSPGDDTFRQDATFAEMTGDGFAFSGNDFESVGAFANQGGEDLAIINATNNDDIFLSKNGIGTLLGIGFTFNATDFEIMEAYGIAGGTNRAILQGSNGVDQFFRSPDGSTLVVDGNQVLARDFAIATALGNGGLDTANLHDSAGDDFFFTQPGSANLSTGGAPYANAIGFPRISVRSLLGNDEVFMTAPGDNIFSADNDSANLINGDQYVLSTGFNTATARVLPGFNDDYLKRVTDFKTVFARAVNGGINRNQLNVSLSFDLETIGDWI